MSDDISKIESRWESAYKDVDFTKLPWETVEPDKELIHLVKEKKIKLENVLDIGCGSGTNSIFLAKSGANVTGLDISPSAIEIATERARRENVSCKFIVDNAYDLNFPDNEFTFIFDRGCFHHIPSELREKYIDGLSKVLKKDGDYYLQAFSEKNNWGVDNEFSIDEIKIYFEGKFKILELKELVHTEPEGRDVILWSVLMKKI